MSESKQERRYRRMEVRSFISIDGRPSYNEKSVELYGLHEKQRCLSAGIVPSELYDQLAKVPESQFSLV